MFQEYKEKQLNIGTPLKMFFFKPFDMCFTYLQSHYIIRFREYPNEFGAKN